MAADEFISPFFFSSRQRDEQNAQKSSLQFMTFISQSHSQVTVTTQIRKEGSRRSFILRNSVILKYSGFWHSRLNFKLLLTKLIFNSKIFFHRRTSLYPLRIKMLTTYLPVSWKHLWGQEISVKAFIQHSSSSGKYLPKEPATVKYVYNRNYGFKDWKKLFYFLFWI